MARTLEESDHQLTIAKALLKEMIMREGLHISPDKKRRNKELKKLVARIGCTLEEIKPIILEVTTAAVKEMLA